MTGPSHDPTPRVVVVGSGKGGTGKTLLAANVGIFLATLGKRVVLVDAALGTANLHIFTGGIRSERSLSEVLAGPDTPLADVICPTPLTGLRLIAGARDPMWAGNPKTVQVQRLIAGLREIRADYVVVDLGGGTASWALDVFLAADLGVITTVPEPTSVELCYRFLRAAFLRRLRRSGAAEAARFTPDELRRFEGGIPAPLDLYDRARAAGQDELAVAIETAINGFRPYLVINAARSKGDMELGRAMALAVRRRLGLPLGYLGHLEYDEAVWVAVRRRRPLLVEHPESRVSKCIEKVTRRLLTVQSAERELRPVGAKPSWYELFDIAPTATFEDIRRANRRIREIYGRESVVVSGLYDDDTLDQLHRLFDDGYAVLMDATRRKEYDQQLFPDGVPSGGARPVVRRRGPDKDKDKAEAAPSERPPMPELSPETTYTGALLQQIREAHGVELREISERTKIGMGYLQALEGDQFRKLPAQVYVRGFLAEYAKILRLDTQRVLDTYLDRYRAARSKIEPG